MDPYNKKNLKNLLKLPVIGGICAANAVFTIVVLPFATAYFGTLFALYKFVQFKQKRKHR